MKTLFTLTAVVMFLMCGAREARSQAESDACILALDSSAAGSLTANGNTTVTANCSIRVNSSSPDAATLNGIASIALSGPGSFVTVGGVDLSGRAQISPTPTTEGLPGADPFLFLTAPEFPPDTCDFTDVVIHGVSAALHPGVYCGGIQVSGEASVTLDKGTYILQGGGLTVRGNSSLTGFEVMFYNTGTAKSYEAVVIGHNAIVQLSAPTSGPYADVLFFADRTIASPETSGDQTTNVFGGRAESLFEGVRYFPTQTVSLENFTASGCSAVIADKIEFSGETELNCP